MPIYEYACKKCGEDFELFRRLAQMNARAKCTHCGSRATRRKLSLFAVVGNAEVDLTTDDLGPGEFGGGDDDFGGFGGDDMDFDF